MHAHPNVHFPMLACEGTSQPSENVSRPVEHMLVPSTLA